MNIFLLLLKWIYNRINFKLGVIAGIITGTIVGYINFHHGLYEAIGAFSRQFLFNLLMGGYTGQLCQRLALRFQNKWKALPLATLIPTLVAFIGVFSVHYYLGTPEPVDSTIWQVYANLCVFFSMGLVFHEQLQEKYKWINLVFGNRTIK